MKKTKKTIYMNESLLKLSEITKGNSRRTGQFSGTLTRIVDRYKLFLDLTDIPFLTVGEANILSAVVGDGKITSDFLTSLPALICSCSSGTEAERLALAEKLKSLNGIERLALLERTRL
jgi:hypothetical protein